MDDTHKYLHCFKLPIYNKTYTIKSHISHWLVIEMEVQIDNRLQGLTEMTNTTIGDRPNDRMQNAIFWDKCGEHYL